MTAGPVHGTDHHQDAGHGHGHGHGHGNHHHEGDPAPDPAIGEAIWKIDNVELTTVGIDIGSATSHLMFSRLRLRRQSHEYSSSFEVVSRRTLHRSPILLTPYRADGTIDAEVLGRFVDEAYEASGIDRSGIEAGAVILTGVARERSNAPALAALFADEGGRFVCASAGHNMEALLAAHGSGAVARSDGGDVVLNVDVGGGTTKYALCVDGAIVATQAIAGGARLVTFDEDGVVERLEPWLAELAEGVGVELKVGGVLPPETRTRLAAALAERIVDGAHGRADAGVLAGALPAGPRPDLVVLSGGVAEYLAGGAGDDAADGGWVGDLGADLGRALDERRGDFGATVEPAPERVRATVTGASQFTMQVSGNTVHLSGPIGLPLHNLPAVAVRLPDDGFTAATVEESIERGVEQLDLTGTEDPVAVAVRWRGEPLYGLLRAMADGAAAAHYGSARSATPLVLVLEADVGASVGAILREELGVDTGVIVVDGVQLNDLDYVDLGEFLQPANVVPIVIKSLLFPSPQ